MGSIRFPLLDTITGKIKPDYIPDLSGDYALVPASGDPVGSVLTKKSDGSHAYLAREFDVRFYGAACDGTTNDSTAVAAAAAAASAAGGGIVRFPRGTTLAASIPIYTGAHYLGAGYGATTVKQPNGTNAPVFITDQFASLTGTNTSGGPYTWSVRDLTVDGNKANNPSGGNGLSIYGSNFTLAHLRIINCRGKGIYSEWTTNTVTSGGGLEARLEDVNLADAEQMAVQWLGPHDAIWHGVVASNCARTSGDAIFDTINVVAIACHGWGAYHARTWILRSGSEIHNSRCEGGSTSQVQILANDQIVNDCNIFNGQSGANASYGVEIGDGTHAPANYRVTGKITECGNGSGGGALNFANDGGQGNIDAQIFQSAGTMLVGTPNSSTAHRLACNGSATKPSHTHVWPSATTPQFNGGVDVDAGSVRLRAALSNQFTAFLNANPYFALDALNKRVLLENSAVLRVFSDALVTKTFEIDGATGIITLASGLKVVPVTGSPEGATTAPVGSLAVRIDGGAGTSLYVKESGTGNTGWVPVGSLARNLAAVLGVAAIVGNYYATPGVVISTGIVGNGSERSTPIVVGRDCTIDTLSVSCTVNGSAGSLVRLGIRADNGGVPGTLLVDAGTVDTSTTGVKTATLGTPLAVTLGTKLHLTATPQGAPTTGPTLRTHAQQTAAYGGIGDASATNVLDTVLTAYQATGTTGALPSTQSWSGAGAAIRVAAHFSA